ncbi:MAG: spherulation-specific family 4 protein [Thermosynechococcaceae cyanobacterium]
MFKTRLNFAVTRWVVTTVATILTFPITIGSTTLPAKAGLCQSLSIPAYFFPGGSPNYWTEAIASAPQVDVMIMNPNSGPGGALDPSYVTAVANAQAVGIKVLGYVPTSYGNRAASLVKSDINLYRNWYKVDGIFFDETASVANKISYYKSLAQYVRSGRGNFVMLNPGIFPDQGYMKIADRVIVFENTYSAYVRSWTPPTWLYNYPAQRFVHLVHATSAAQLGNAVTLSTQRNASSVFITNDVLPNPWDTLPSYWNKALSTLKQKCSI